MEVFADGINNITEAQTRVALRYFSDGSIEGACPPVKALLHIMAHGHYDGKLVEDPEIRRLFTRESLLSSDWYHERLLNKQLSDIALFQKHVKYLKNHLSTSFNLEDDEEKDVIDKLKKAEDKLKYYKSTEYLKSLEGFLGLDPYVK
jgi:hypothetical protein